jgi:polyisoprenoid-binding protein YceI
VSSSSVSDVGGGAIRIQASSLETKIRKRDDHLRAPDFFDAESHPAVTVAVARLDASADGTLTGEVSLEASGHARPIDSEIHVVALDGESATLRGEAIVDRTELGTTWSPLGMAARQARVVITARFVRQ